MSRRRQLSKKAALVLLIGGMGIVGVAVAQIQGQALETPTNPVYVILLALTPLLITVIGYLISRGINQIDEGQKELEQKREADRILFNVEKKGIFEAMQKDRDAIYETIRRDREQLTRAVEKIGDALVDVDKRMIAIATTVDIKMPATTKNPQHGGTGG